MRTDQKLKVFVVEDHDESFEVLSSVLEGLPCVEVIGRAVTADTATRWICRKKPDLAIIDLNLMRGSGLEVIRTARQARSSTKLLAMSDTDSYHAAVAAGANWFYAKPLGFEDLIDRVTWLKVELFDDGPDWYLDTGVHIGPRAN